MNLYEFTNRFPDEKSCISEFKRIRDELGVVCKRCGHSEHYWRKRDLKYECKRCHSRQSLRSGTVMEKSKLPFRYWLMAIHLLTSTKKTFSTSELQRQIGHQRYEPIWYMLHKLRLIMGKRESEYQISTYIELDDAFFEVVRKGNEEQREYRENVGRGSQRQAKVLVAVESEPQPEEESKYRVKRKCGYLKMVVVEYLSNEAINDAVEPILDFNSIVETDGYKGYSQLIDVIKTHRKIILKNQKQAHKLLPWVHTVIGNAKRILNAFYHSVGNEYLQNYLNEFCYKFNRRYLNQNIFDRLLRISVAYRWY